MTVSPDPTVRLPVGLSTGIGCLPHHDPGEAVEFVLRHSPGLPAAPSLPGRSPREGMVARAATGLAGISVGDDGSLDIDHAALDPDAPLDPAFDTDAFVGLRAFLNAIADRTGPIKVSLTGPVTLGVALQAAGIDRELAFRISGPAVRARGRALIDLVLQRVPQAQLVVFVDEPALVGLTEKGFPVGPNDGVDLVSGALASHSSRWPSRGWTAAARPTGASPWRQVPGSCPSRSAPASSATPGSSGTSSTRGVGWRGGPYPSTDRSARRWIACGVGSSRSSPRSATAGVTRPVADERDGHTGVRSSSSRRHPGRERDQLASAGASSCTTRPPGSGRPSAPDGVALSGVAGRIETVATRR